MSYGYFKQVKGRWVQHGEAYEKRAVAVAVYQDKLIWQGGEIRKTSAHKASADPRPAICKPCSKHLHGNCEHGDCHCGCKAFWPANAAPPAEHPQLELDPTCVLCEYGEQHDDH